MPKMILECTVNDEPVEVLVQPYETLLEALRDRLGLTGTKEGCGTGDCGACSMLLDGKPVTTCLVLSATCNNREVTTVEGLAKPGELTPLQRAFSDHHALQCGFCTPGILMAAAERLDQTATGQAGPPDEDEIRRLLSGHLCRCTGYEPIVTAILEIAGTGAGLREDPGS